MEYKLDEVHKQIAPNQRPHKLHHEGHEPTQQDQFLRFQIAMGTVKNRIPQKAFAGGVGM